MSFMHGIAQGAAVFNVEGQATTGSGQPAIWDSQGNVSSTYTRYVLPFMRGVVHHGMAAPKEDVLEKVKIAVRQTEVFQNIAHNGDYGVFKPLYEATYGFRENGEIYEYFPNTGRYYYIPLLPYQVVTLGDAHTVRLADLTTSPTIRALFDAYYTQDYVGDALVSVVGDRVFIQSTHENENVTETFEIPFGPGHALTSLSGTVGPHHYVMGRFEQDGACFWLQTNTEYPERNTRLFVSAGRALAVDVSPESALVKWAAEAEGYRLELSHTSGAVEATIRSTETGADTWTLYDR